MLNQVTPGVGQFSLWGHHLSNLGRGPLEDVSQHTFKL